MWDFESAWELLFDEVPIFGTVALLWRPVLFDPHFGKPGIRDSDHPCSGFEPGDPGTGSCDTDGHYMCLECKHMSRSAVAFREES